MVNAPFSVYYILEQVLTLFMVSKMVTEASGKQGKYTSFVCSSFLYTFPLQLIRQRKRASKHNNTRISDFYPGRCWLLIRWREFTSEGALCWVHHEEAGISKRLLRHLLKTVRLFQRYPPNQNIHQRVSKFSTCKLGVNQCYIIGGDGTHRAGALLAGEIQKRGLCFYQFISLLASMLSSFVISPFAYTGLKMSIVAVPKTIDNDIGSRFFNVTFFICSIGVGPHQILEPLRSSPSFLTCCAWTKMIAFISFSCTGVLDRSFGFNTAISEARKAIASAVIGTRTKISTPPSFALSFLKIVFFFLLAAILWRHSQRLKTLRMELVLWSLWDGTPATLLRTPP